MNIKKHAARLAAFALALPALAQESSTPEINTQAAGNAVDAVGNAISTLLSGKVMTNVLLVIGAGLAIAMIFLGIRWILKGGKTAAKG